MRSRGVKQALFVVLTGVQMPAALVEIGFVTSPADEPTLKQRRRARSDRRRARARRSLEFGAAHAARLGRAPRPRTALPAGGAVSGATAARRRRAAPGAARARLHRESARVGAVPRRAHARAVHRVRGGVGAALPAGPRPGLDHRRVRDAARRDRHARRARVDARPAVGAQPRDPAPDRPQPARRRGPRRARRAHALGGLRRAPGRRRHALRVDHRRLRGARARRPSACARAARSRARSLRDARGGRLRRHRGRRDPCSTCPTPRTRAPRST